MATTTAICTKVASRLDQSQGANPFAGTPAIYVTPDYVSWTHSLSNRLGRGTDNNDVTVLLDGTEQQQISYVKGILLAAIIIFFFFLLWMLIVLILKCCGYQRVGFFSGQRIRRPLPPTPPVLSQSFSLMNTKSLQEQARVTESKKAKRILSVLEQEEQSLALQQQQPQQHPAPPTITTVTADEEAQQSPSSQAAPPGDHGDCRSTSLSAAVVEYKHNVQAWQVKVKRAEQVQRRIRITVIFCCLAVITSAILLLIYGIGAIKDSLNQVQDGLDQTSNLATSGINVINEFLVAQNQAVNVTESIMNSVNGICPAVQETLCQDIFQQTDCNLTGIPFKDEIQQVIEVFDDLLVPIAQTSSSNTNCATTPAAVRRRLDDSAVDLDTLIDEAASNITQDEAANLVDQVAAAAAAAAEGVGDVDLDTLIDEAASNITQDEAANLVDQVAAAGAAADLISSAGAAVEGAGDALCDGASNVNQVEDSLNQVGNTLNQVQDALNQVDQVLAAVKYDLFKALNGAKSELQKVVKQSNQVNQQVGSFSWAFDVAAAFAICLAVLSVFIMIGVILAWRNELNGSCFRWVRNLVMVPIFVLLVFLSLVFCCVFVTGSITTSDVCYKSPDSLVMHVLEEDLFPELKKSNKEFGPILAEFISFYVQGCPETVVPLDIDEMLTSKLNYVNDIVTPLQSVLASQDFTDICGSNSGLASGMQTMLDIMCVVSLLVLDVRDLLNCNNGNSVYTTFAYEAVCYDATKGFVWICSTQLAIVFFSMLIMTLRVACFEIEDEEDFMKQRKCCARLCCGSSKCGSSKDEENEANKQGSGANEGVGGESGIEKGPIKTLDSDGDANDGVVRGDNDEPINTIDSKSGEEPRHVAVEENGPPMNPTTEAKIY